MSDRRLTPANGRVAATSLKGQVKAEAFVDGVWRQIAEPVADILATPGGRRDRQALYGEHVLVLEDHQGFAFIQAARDGYCGYLRSADLSRATEPSHWVSARSTHLYSEPDIKSPDMAALSFGSYLTIVATHDRFLETDGGLFAPKQHLTAAGQVLDDPVTVAALFLGTPYLWGGDGYAGIDCSGLVQVAHLACGISCPGDSDLQASELGAPLPGDAPLQRGDLLFWKSHVALCVDDRIMLHANAHDMAVAYEPITEAITRIAAQGEGPVTARKRIGS